MEKRDTPKVSNNKLYSTLTNTELEILRLIKQGYLSKEIAESRNCSNRTVEKHRSNIIKKLGLAPGLYALQDLVFRKRSI